MLAIPIFIPITPPSHTQSAVRNGLESGDWVMEGRARVTSVLKGQFSPSKWQDGGFGRVKEQIMDQGAPMDRKEPEEK